MRLSSFWLAISLTTACANPDAPAPDATQPEQPGIPGSLDGVHSAGEPCTAVENTAIDRSLVVTDPAILGRFPFAVVMGRVRATGNLGVTNTTELALFQSWMWTFGASNSAGDCDDPNIDPNHYGLRCPRLPEAKLATVNPFDPASNVAFVPIGLFNRFDLAPADGADCGEYRIVYAMRSTNPNIAGRALIIFEATLPNPRRDLGLRGCLPVAQYWQNLSNDDDPTSRAVKLEAFYLMGTAIPGFPAVVDARNYGLATGTGPYAAGQVRTNFFIDSVEWHLREFKLRRLCDPSNPANCKVRFDHVTVKSNPAEELFAGTHTRSESFRAAFANSVGSLASPNVSTIGMSIEDVFNEFESVSQTQNVAFNSIANQAMRDAVAVKLPPLNSGLTANDILTRATTQTCAGCHQVSNNANLGGGLVWPPSLGFVQIDEAGTLSQALTTQFLPHRKIVLEEFINAACVNGTTNAAADARRTLGGSMVGAAN